MSIELKKSSTTELAEVEPQNNKPATKQKKKKKSRQPQKRTMNLFYKPDRTTKPATIALYVLFVFVCLLGLSKILILDLWLETREAQQTLAAAEDELTNVMLQIMDYDEVKERYQRYSATEEEKALLDRLEILALLDSAVGETADISSISISTNTVSIQFSGVTLAQTADIVRKLEASPLVAYITVNTAATEGTTTANSSAPVYANAVIQLQKEVAE